MTLPLRRGAEGHNCPVYEAYPVGRARGLVAVVHEIFGLTPHIHSVCDRLANAGYHAIAPDLFFRAFKESYLPYTAEGKHEGLRIKNLITEELMMRDLVGVLSDTNSSAPKAIMGFCLGGTIVWLAAVHGAADAVVGYYSIGLSKHLAEGPRCPVLLHFGRTDSFISNTEIGAVSAAFPKVEIHKYDAGHAFIRDDEAAYVAAAATQAWTWSLGFLDAHIGKRSAA